MSKKTTTEANLATAASAVAESTPHPRNSETALMEQLINYSDAGGSVIQIRTREPLRCATTLRKHFIGAKAPYREWDIINGFRTFTTENLGDHRIKGDDKDFFSAFKQPLDDIRSIASGTGPIADNPETLHYYVFVDPQPFLVAPNAQSLVQQYASILPSTQVCILLVTPDEPLAMIPSGNLLVADFPTPTADELAEVLTRLITDALEDDENVFRDNAGFTEEEMARLAHLGLGLSLAEFETYVALTIINAHTAGETSLTMERFMDGIGEGKTQVVRQSEILELIPTTDIADVGGMERLKKWISVRANSYSDEARAFGVEVPKGIACVGVPGTGKSLLGKAIGHALGVPLVRFDISRVFSKYVGDSESRMRSALKMVESMAPCVLFVDEIDKSLSGTGGGGGDSGTSTRVLGSFLTWLQDCKAPIFTMVTANRVDGLPPELLRKGRFDQIFSVGLPSARSRKEVLAIHLRKRGRDIENFDAAELAEFSEVSNNFVPAEIEAAVKDALTYAFNDPKAEELEMRHIIQALRETIPMSKSNADQIEAIAAWAASSALSVKYDERSPDPDAPSQTRIGLSSSSRIVRPSARSRR